MSVLTDTKPLLPKARALVIERQMGSVSLVQRYLQIGYNAASELLEMLETEGIVGRIGTDGKFGRAVLVKDARMRPARPDYEVELNAQIARFCAENAEMPQSTAERQKAFKEAQKAAGMVRLEAYVTDEQREKYKQLGGEKWLRKKIDAAKVKGKE